MTKKTHRILLLVIFIAALAYLLAFLHGLYSPEIRLLPDSHEYLNAANNLKNHGVFYSGSLKAEIDYSLYSKRPPGYPFLLMLLFLVSPSLALPVLFQVLLIFLGGFLLWRINENAEVPWKLNVLALAVYLLYPGQIIYSQMIMAETALQFLLLSSVYCLMLFLKRKSSLPILLLNLCIAASILLKPVMLYFWIPNLILHLLYYKKTSKRILLIAPLLPLLCISLWSWRNYQATGVYHFSSLQATHLKFFIPGGDNTLTVKSKEAFKKEIRETKEKSAEAMLDPDTVIDNIVHDTKNMFAFFLDPGRFDLYKFIPVEGKRVSSHIFYWPATEWSKYFRAIPIPILILLCIFFACNLLIITAFLPYAFISKTHFFLRLYLITVILYMGGVVSLAALGTSRYRLSVEPLLIIGAAATAAHVWNFYKNRK